MKNLKNSCYSYGEYVKAEKQKKRERVKKVVV